VYSDLEVEDDFVKSIDEDQEVAQIMNQRHVFEQMFLEDEIGVAEMLEAEEPAIDVSFDEPVSYHEDTELDITPHIPRDVDRYELSPLSSGVDLEPRKQ
jgi:uncharacterized protein (UPF0254 family)